MEEQDFLFLMAEISIGIITFTALVLVLRQLVGGPLTKFHLLYIRQTAINGFSVVMFSLMPVILSYFDVSNSIVIRISSGLIGIGALNVLIWYFLARRKAAPDRPQNLGTLLAGCCLILVPLISIPNALGMYAADSFGPYAAALFLFLMPVAISFLATLRDFLLKDND